MIQQRVGDLLEIRWDGKYYYLVVLTKIVMFGGNIAFAYHTDGKKQKLQELLANRGGFNICTDLLLPKKSGQVIGLHRFDDVSHFWLSPYRKACNAWSPGQKAKEWFIYQAANPGDKHIARVATLTQEYRLAMDDGCYSFDLVVDMIKRKYTPDQNEHI